MPPQRNAARRIWCFKSLLACKGHQGIKMKSGAASRTVHASLQVDEMWVASSTAALRLDTSKANNPN